MQCVQSPESPTTVVTHKRRHLYQKYNSNSDEDISTEPGCQELAVYAENLCKRYDNGPPVVRNLCMNVRRGTIYGFLGSSGCGKTTMLSLIVGLQKWDSGKLLVFGRTPGSRDSMIPGKRLGYMPQDLALYKQLSVKEVVQFYGRIYNMTSSKLEEQFNFLSELLELPTSSKPIKDLSGGEKRRASLALALIHSPELIVLDEPTVGLDPLLRVNIWDYLYKIVSTLSTTIIITTHYIEEARLSNTIGVMRNGRLLVEESPLNLLDRYRCELLEQAVLQLCRSDDDNANSDKQEMQITFKSSWNKNLDSNMTINNDQDEYMRGVFRKAIDFDHATNLQSSRQMQKGIDDGILGKIRTTGIYQRIQKVHGLAIVNFLPFIRHPLFLAIYLILPSVQGAITLFCLAAKPLGLHFGIVNYDLVNWTLECNLPVHHGNSCDLTSLSCKYLNDLKNTDLIVLDSYDNEEDAVAQVHLGRSFGYLMFPHNYSQNGVDLATAKKFASNESIEGSRIHAHLDYSQFVHRLFMIKHLVISYLEFVRHLANSCGIVGKESEYPLHFRTPVYGDYEDNGFLSFVMPGAIICTFIFILAVATSILMITDRKQGTVDRARVAGLVTGDILLGHLATQGLIAVAQVAIWFGVLRCVFAFDINGSYWLCAFICLISGICGISLGLLFGVICKDEIEATVFGIFITPFLLLYGGVFWPTESMPQFWQHFGYLLPTSLPISSLRSVAVRGLGITHPLVWPGILVTIAWTLLLIACSAVADKKVRR